MGSRKNFLIGCIYTLGGIALAGASMFVADYIRSKKVEGYKLPTPDSDTFGDIGTDDLAGISNIKRGTEKVKVRKLRNSSEAKDDNKDLEDSQLDADYEELKNVDWGDDDSTSETVKTCDRSISEDECDEYKKYYELMLKTFADAFNKRNFIDIERCKNMNVKIYSDVDEPFSNAMMLRSKLREYGIPVEIIIKGKKINGDKELDAKKYKRELIDNLVDRIILSVDNGEKADNLVKELMCLLGISINFSDNTFDSDDDFSEDFDFSDDDFSDDDFSDNTFDSDDDFSDNTFDSDDDFSDDLYKDFLDDLADFDTFEIWSNAYLDELFNNDTDLSDWGNLINVADNIDN